MQVGYTLASDALPARAVVDQAVAAEEAGFDFVDVSDHVRSRFTAIEHANVVWSLLAAVAARTERIGLVTTLSCPHHPAATARTAATVQVLSQGRLTVGIGAGHRLDEHVVGGYPAIRHDHERFREALAVIRLLWAGGASSQTGMHPRSRTIRGFDLPEHAPVVCVAVGGRTVVQSALAVQIALELGAGLFATKPVPELVDAYTAGGGTGPRYCTIAAGSSEGAGEPDVARILPQAQRSVDAGFDHLTLQNVRPDLDGGVQFCAEKLLEPLRGLTPNRPCANPDVLMRTAPTVMTSAR